MSSIIGTKCSNIYYMNKFSERLKDLRNEKGISRAELADRLNVSVRLIAYWENGQRECGFDMLLALSEIFCTSTDYLLGKSEY